MAAPLVSMAVRRLIFTALLASCLAHALLQDDEDLTFDDEDHAARSKLGESVAPVSAPHEALEDSLKPLVRTRRQFGSWFGTGGNTVDDVDAEEGSAVEEGSAYGSRTYRVKVHVLTNWGNQYGSRNSNDYQVLARRIRSAFTDVLRPIDGEKSYTLAKCSRSLSGQIMAWVDIMHEDPADQKAEVQRLIRRSLATGRLNDLNVNSQYYEFSEPLDCSEPGQARLCGGDEDTCLFQRQMCDGTVDCNNGADESDCVVVCPENQFQCDNGDCIESFRRCDLIADCVNAEDEASCLNGVCPEGQFKCTTDGSCIPVENRCDGLMQCYDGSDEDGCPCNYLTEWQCDYGECIDRRLKCNSKQDCPHDNSDEQVCPCQSGQHQCERDGTCISESQLCDGRPDCSDFSDELNCPPTTCGRDEWRCSDGQCIPRLYLCDGRQDCADNSDEGLLCQPPPSSTTPRTPSCGVGEFECRDGRCIPSAYRCDGVDDCDDGSDEWEQQCSCKTNEFKCGDGTCIPDYFRCDRNFDCTDGSDERDNCACGPSEFHCISGNCVPNSVVCDGTADCRDGSDEKNCSCGSIEWQCEAGDCIYPTQVCNGVRDCSDGSDERGCPEFSQPCFDNQFRCSTGECIDNSQLCDGFDDCDDGQDERFCPTTSRPFTTNPPVLVPESADIFQCQDGSTIAKSLRCNGRWDCPDGSDESGCVEPEIDLRMYPNQQTIQQSKSQYLNVPHSSSSSSPPSAHTLGISHPRILLPLLLPQLLVFLCFLV